VDQSDKTFTIRLKGESYKLALENGLVYTLHHPIKKPGAYQLRAAVRDDGAEVVGAASQFIEVPDVSKGRLAMSGVFVKSPVAQGAPDDPKANPAMRIFTQGQQMIYAFQIINAHPDDEKKPQLETQVRVFHDGKPVFEGKPLPFVPDPNADPANMLAGGQLRLSKVLPPGEYVLQVEVTDKLAKPKQNTASQWVDFELTAPPPAAPPQ